jgi:hypothetical protein
MLCIFNTLVPCFLSLLRILIHYLQFLIHVTFFYTLQYFRIYNKSLTIFMTLFLYFSYIFHILYTLPVFFKYYYVLSIHFFHICKTTYYVFSIHFSLFLIHYLCINQSHKANDVRDQRKSGPWSPLGKYVYRMKNSHNKGLACTSSVTRELMEHGGRLPANSALTVYYLPVYSHITTITTVSGLTKLITLPRYVQSSVL